MARLQNNFSMYHNFSTICAEKLLDQIAFSWKNNGVKFGRKLSGTVYTKVLKLVDVVRGKAQ